MKDILIIANFCRDFSKSDNGRFMYLCKQLSKNNNVEIVTSNFIHDTKEFKEPLIHNWPFKITFLNEPGYKKNVSLKRFVSHYYWGKEVKKYLTNRDKPDIIYCAIPSLTAPYFASKYCKKNKVKFIIDVQDLWPEAFKMVFDIPIISDVLFSPFKFLADSIYKSADYIIAVSETYASRALRVNKKCKNSLSVFLGTALDTFDKYSKYKKILKGDELWLGYCGSLSSSYDLTIVFDALKLLIEKGVNTPVFVVMGNGEKMELFQSYSEKLNIKTIFTDRLPYDQMCGVLSQCDIVVNPISHNSACSIINKVGDYAASGTAVINTQENQEYRNLVEKYEMGFNCNNADSYDIALKLELLIKDENLRKKMGKGARNCAEELFDRNRTYNKIVNLVENA